MRMANSALAGGTRQRHHVTLARHSDDVGGLTRVFFHLLAQPRDVDAQHGIVPAVILTPHGAQQFLMADDAAGHHETPALRRALMDFLAAMRG